MDNIHMVKETTLTVEKKSLLLALLYLGSISLQIREKLKKSLNTSLIIVDCKQHLKIRPDQVTTFISRIGFAKIFPLVSFISFKFIKSYFGECVRLLNVRIGEHILVYDHLPRNRLNLRIPPQSIIDYFATIQHPLKILVF